MKKRIQKPQYTIDASFADTLVISIASVILACFSAMEKSNAFALSHKWVTMPIQETLTLDRQHIRSVDEHTFHVTRDINKLVAAKKSN